MIALTQPQGLGLAELGGGTALPPQPGCDPFPATTALSLLSSAQDTLELMSTAPPKPLRGPGANTDSCKTQLHQFSPSQKSTDHSPECDHPAHFLSTPPSLPFFPLF